VVVLYLTRGESTEAFGPLPPQEVARRRTELAERAAGILDVEHRFLDLPDGGLTADPATARAVARVVAEVRPDGLLTWGQAWLKGMRHPDHLATGRAAVDAVTVARIRKLVENPDWSAILLARAGLERLGIYRPGESAFAWGDGTVHAHELDPGEFFPAASQGAVAAEIRSENDLARRAMAAINHEPTYRRISAERAFLARLGAGCQTPVGARTWYEEDGSVLAMAVRVFDEDDPSAEPFVAEARGAPADPEGLANQLMQSKGESPDLK